MNQLVAQTILRASPLLSKVEESKKFKNSKRQHWRAFPGDDLVLEQRNCLLISKILEIKMGGLGSGQTGWKTKAEHCLAIDVRCWAREGRLVPDSYFLGCVGGGTTTGIGVLVRDGDLMLGYSHRGGELKAYRIELMWTDCHFGGARVWFRCPGCHRRAAKLFLEKGHFACRRCQKLAYLSQSRAGQHRPLYRAFAIQMRLGGEPGLDHAFP
jgi:hypothetical protein